MQRFQRLKKLFVITNKTSLLQLTKKNACHFSKAYTHTQPKAVQIMKQSSKIHVYARLLNTLCTRQLHSFIPVTLVSPGRRGISSFCSQLVPSFRVLLLEELSKEFELYLGVDDEAIMGISVFSCSEASRFNKSFQLQKVETPSSA